MCFWHILFSRWQYDLGCDLNGLILQFFISGLQSTRCEQWKQSCIISSDSTVLAHAVVMITYLYSLLSAYNEIDDWLSAHIIAKAGGRRRPPQPESWPEYKPQAWKDVLGY